MPLPTLSDGYFGFKKPSVLHNHTFVSNIRRTRDVVEIRFVQLEISCTEANIFVCSSVYLQQARQAGSVVPLPSFWQFQFDQPPSELDGARPLLGGQLQYRAVRPPEVPKTFKIPHNVWISHLMSQSVDAMSWQHLRRVAVASQALSSAHTAPIPQVPTSPAQGFGFSKLQCSLCSQPVPWNSHNLWCVECNSVACSFCASRPLEHAHPLHRLQCVKRQRARSQKCGRCSRYFDQSFHGFRCLSCEKYSICEYSCVKDCLSSAAQHVCRKKPDNTELSLWEYS